jgi:hypothetical protein
VERREHPKSPTKRKDTGEQGKMAGSMEVAPSPSYANIARKKMMEPVSSLEDEIFERLAKREGRESHKEAREEEAEIKKTQGIQPTIEMSIDRNTRIRSQKGGGPSTPTSK